ncbi:MAG: LPS assembly protein LptD [Alphaproteobacteria bacterium]
MGRWRGAIIAFGIILCWTGTTHAQQRILRAGQEVLFKADSIDHDRQLGVVTARGNVEIVQGERVLRADLVNFNLNADLMTATGNIALMEPGGEVIFADHVELTGDFKTGAVENIRILMSDNARLAAVDGRRIGGNVTELNKAVYSPCRKCLAPDGAPLWRVKAVKVIHNKAEQLIEYRDAWLEVMGVPVAYTPYLSHPDPAVKRKSGLLVPRYGNDTELGFIIETPYYFNIAPDKDATLHPIFTSKEGPVLAGEYRQRFTNGRLRTDASLTNGSTVGGGDDTRGHIFGEARFDLNDTWRMGADIQLASDDTYLRRYDFNALDTLTNNVFIEGFRGRNYARAEGFFWRGLRENDDPGITPIVAPLIGYSFVGDPGLYGGRWGVDANLMVLTQKEGNDSRRLSLRTGWELPHIASTGEVWHLFADLRTDAYWVDDVQEPDRTAGDLSSGLTGRIMPTIGLDWRFPFARSNGSITQIIEPVAGVILSPNGGNPDKIPNEDSQDFEIDDTNLVSHNRFTGLDRIESGQRVYYGMHLSANGASGYSDAFIGQSYRLRRDASFASNSGLDENFSDFVGRVNIRPNLPVRLQYRFRIDKDELTARRSEVLATFGPPAFKASLDYAFFGRGSGSGEFNDREELTAVLRSQLTKKWAAYASTRRDLQGGKSLANRFGLQYVCDCFTFSIDYIRTFTQDRDIRPSEKIFFRLIFKNLGSVEAAAGRSSRSAIAQPEATQ